jgi:hypothetical protein
MIKEKYRNKKTVVGSLKFDSKAEAARYSELLLLQRAGVIRELKLQEEFTLIGKQDGERAVKYRADFTYREGVDLVVEDLKSKATITPVYIIKRKLMLERHGIRIKEVIR